MKPSVPGDLATANSCQALKASISVIKPSHKAYSKSKCRNVVGIKEHVFIRFVEVIRFLRIILIKIGKICFVLLKYQPG